MILPLTDVVRRYDEGRKNQSGGLWWGRGHMPKVAYINLLANLTYCIMMKMLSRDLQNNGDEFCGGLWKDGAEGGCSSVKRRGCELLSHILCKIS